MGKIDAHHHGALLCELLSKTLSAVAPTLIAGQEQHEARRSRRRAVNPQVLEAAMAQVRGSGCGHLAEKRQQRHQQEGFHRLVILGAQNARE